MEREAWWASIHGGSELDMTERLTHSLSNGFHSKIIFRNSFKTAYLLNDSFNMGFEFILICFICRIWPPKIENIGSMMVLQWPPYQEYPSSSM